MKNILVTGAGALLGQGILRCLQGTTNTYRIVSADPSEYATGHFLADTSYLIPFANHPGYLDRIEEIIVQEKIDLILIGTDVELLFFAKYQEYLETKHSLVVVVSSSEVITIANDKWLTAEFLRKNDFPYPKSALTTDANGIARFKEGNEFPLIAKPVDGARSKGLIIVQNDKELQKLASYQNNLVVQELISEDDGEFTTGCIVIAGVCVAVVSMVRDLRDGNTWRAFRDGNETYDQRIKEIAEKLNVEGPVNFQYRIRNGEPVIFEINCRFSGTTPLRAMFGFNEVEALIAYYLEGKTIEPPVLREGTILRTYSDVFVEHSALKQFKETGVSKNLPSHYYPFKNR